MLEKFLIVPLAAYGFGIAIQMLRGRYLNFKPFNCRACLGAWSSFAIYVLFDKCTYFDYFVYSLFVFCLANFLKLIEDKIIGDKGIL